MNHYSITFGTDGWRGIIDAEINHTTVGVAAQAFARYLQQTVKGAELRAAVAYDGRKNSREYALVFARVLSGNGVRVHLSDAVTATPVLSYYVLHTGMHAGVMITASHNPPEYNGIKFKGSYGGPFFTEETRKVEALLGSEPVQADNRFITVTSLFAPYEAQVKRFIDFEVIRKSGISVLMDSMAGAGQQIVEHLLLSHNCKCTTIFSEPKPDFSGRLAEPIERNLMPLKDALQDGGFAFGAATDGDADRCGIMYDDGTWMSAQETILLLADYLVNARNVDGSLVKTSSVTAKLEQFFADERSVHDVQVGFKYICEQMIADGAAFGAEESGGFGYKGHMPERDGILTALLFAEMIARSGSTTLSSYASARRAIFGEIYYGRIDYHFEGAGRLQRLPGIAEHQPRNIAGFAVAQVQLFLSSRGIVNGMKFILEGNTRWLLLRCSETEPMFRIYAEGDSSGEVTTLLEAGKQLILGKQ